MERAAHPSGPHRATRGRRALALTACFAGCLFWSCAVEASDNAPALRISGLSSMMTGWREVVALSEDPRIHRVDWRLNGRPTRSEHPFRVSLYFGRTPQPHTLEAIAYDQHDTLQYAVKTTVNAGGRATLLDFLSPSSGARVEGQREVEVCAGSPADRPVDRVELEYRTLDDRAGRVFAMEPRGAAGCLQGQLYSAAIVFSARPASLTARLFTGRAQARPAAAAEDAILVNMPPSFGERMEVRLLEWPVHVYRNQQPVQGLEADHFRLQEDRRDCPIRTVLEAASVPLRIGLVFDWSVSTWIDAEAEATAATEFLRQLFDASKDSALMYAISQAPISLLPWTSDESRIQKALDEVRSHPRAMGGTALYDTLAQVLYEFQSGASRGVPALVVMTDGIDNESWEFDQERILQYARESGVRIYPIAIRARLSRTESTRVASEFLEALATETGGTFYTLELNGFPQRLRQQADRLRREARSLAEHPGELAQDPRFLAHLIEERETGAAMLDAEAARLERKNETPLALVGDVFKSIREELSSAYVVVAEGQAPRSDRWHEVRVMLTNLPDARKYVVRAASGLYW